MLDDGDREWLRKLLWRAVCCSLAASPAVAGCGSGEVPESHRPRLLPTPSVVAGSGAPAFGVLRSVAAPLAAACSEGHWQLAPHLTTVSDVDYLADRLPSLAVESEVGSACVGVADFAACQALLQMPPPGIGRHLATTAGGVIRHWSAVDAPVLLGAIDAPEEAIWLALAHGFAIACGASVFEQQTTAGMQFAVVVGAGVVRVDQSGNTWREQPSQPPTDPCCEGRRPEGLRSQHRPTSGSALGEHFAAMAHMEAASVPAFAAIATELACHAAPATLVRSAHRALRDEISHARIAGALARRFGASPTPAVVAPTPPRSLEAFALDNAVEGCVNETYAAAEAAFQAARATDPVVRSALASIAIDEARHAALSWRIARWATPRLPLAARAWVRQAQDEAVSQLGARLRAAEPMPEVLQRVAGLPDARFAAALHTELCRDVWHA